MNYLKNKFSKIIIFIVVISLLLLLIIPAGIIFGNSDKDLKEEYEKALIALKTAQEEVTRAESDLESVKLIEAEARTYLEAVGQELTVINENFASVSPEVEKLKEKLVFAQAAAEEANSFYDRIKETGTEEEINATKNAADNAKNELSSITAEYDAANSNLMVLQKELDEAKAEFKKVKSAADEANVNLKNAEQFLNEKNENLNQDLSEVERTKAEFEAYQAKTAEDKESAASNKENKNEEIIEEEEIVEEDVVEDEITIEEGIEEEVAGEVVTEESMLESEEADVGIVEEEVVEEEESTVEEVVEVKIDISFSRDENGYIQAGQVTTFSAVVEGIDPFQYFWDFGDGSSLSSQNPQYAYASDGNFTLSLTILDVDGNAYSKSVTVNVSDYVPTTTEYWISPDAGDDGIGTIDNPASIGTVLSNTVNGDTLYFLPGAYNTAVNLDGIGTGTEELPINFIAYDNVIFDGQSTLDNAFYFSSSLSYLSFYNFTFINYLGSAIYIDNEDVVNINIVDNTFSGNGAAIDITMDSGLNIQNNIIVDNEEGIAVSADNVNIDHNVIAFNGEGIVIDDTRSNVTVNYNDVFGNGTDYQGVEAGENDISVDPEFTDKDNLDFTIPSDSPLYENNIIWESSTDKDDYTLGDQVIISGKGYEPFQNLIIQIVWPDGSLLKEIFVTTDENGNFTYGKYYVDYAGTNYLVKIIDANGNILEILSFTDCYHDIKLIKSGLTCTGLTASFTLYKNGVAVSTKTVSSSNNYTVVWNNQPEGRYTVVETSGPSGYVASIAPDHIDITSQNWNNPCDYPDSYFTFTAVNTRCEGSITINKSGLVGTDSASFTVDGPGTANDYSFSLSAASPQWSNSSLPWGSYTITETTPGGYQTPVFTVNGVPQASGNSVTVVIGDDVGQALEYIVDVENIPYGSITINKSGLIGTDEVTFTLSGPNGYSESHTVSAASPTAEWLDLRYGQYALTETPDPGNTFIYTLTVTPVGPYDIGTGTGESLEYILGAVNTPDCEITLNKTGLDSTDVAGFTLYNSAGAAVGPERIIMGSSSIRWSDLQLDTYKIVETTVPAGYSKISDIEGIVIGAEKHNYTFNRVNTRITVLGSITLNKSGLGSSSTAGFILYNSSGDAVGGERKITGNGAVTWADLPLDTYRIVETTVPAGYSKMSNITGIVVGITQQSFSFSRKNTKTPPPPPPTPPPPSPPVIEVLSISELPFTGMSPFVPIAGISCIIAGVILVVLSISRRRKINPGNSS